MSIRMLFLTVVVTTIAGVASVYAQTEGGAAPDAGAPSLFGKATVARIGAALRATPAQPSEPRWITEGRPCDGCMWRRPGHALVQTTLVNVLYGLGNIWSVGGALVIR